jgi:hypothetical protein
MVEFALILPVIILIVMGIFAFALIFNAQITVANATAAAARAGSTVDYASLTPSDHENQPIYDAIVTNMSWLGMDRVDSITIYQPEEGNPGAISDRKDIINPLNGNLISGNFTNVYRQTNTGLGVEIVYREPVWLPIINLITGDEIEIRVRESRRIE